MMLQMEFDKEIEYLSNDEGDEDISCTKCCHKTSHKEDQFQMNYLMMNK